MSIQTKVTRKSATETASQFGGGVIGAMLSRGVLSVIHDDATNPASGLNKGKLMKQGILAVVGIAGSMFIKADDVIGHMAKGALQGMGTIQGIDAISTYAASTNKATALVSSGTKTDKFVAKSLGLACPGDVSCGMGRPRRRALRGVDAEIPMELVGNSYEAPVKTLDAVFQSGRAV